MSSRDPHDVRKISHRSFNSSQQLFNIRGRASNLPIPPVGNIPSTEVNQYGTRFALSRMGSGLESNLETRPPVFPTSFGMRPPVNVHSTRPPTLNPIFPLEKHVRSQFEAINASSTVVNHGQNKSLMLEQPLDIVENKVMGLSKQHQLPNQLAGKISFNQPNRGQAPQLQIFPSQDAREKFLSSQAPAAALQFSHGNSLQGHTSAVSTAMPNSLPAVQLPFPVQNISNNSSQLPRGALLSLPPVPPSATSLAIPHANAGPIVSNQQPGGALSGLINSLMAQGLISFTNQSPGQVPILCAYIFPFSLHFFYIPFCNLK